MSKSSIGAGDVIIAVLLSILTTAGITAGGFGIGVGVGRVIYGPMDAPLQEPAQNVAQSSEVQEVNNQNAVKGSSIGPNVHEENGVIVWQSEYSETNGGVPNVKNGVLVSSSGASTSVAAEGQSQEQTNSPTQVQEQAEAGQPVQAQAPAQSSTSSPGSGTATSGKPNQPAVNISPNNPSAAKPQTGGTTGGVTQPSGNNGHGNANNFNTYDNAEQQQTTDKWVLNTSTKKIHYPLCNEVKKIAPQNYSTSNLDESELISQGYSTCGRCHK